MEKVRLSDGRDIDIESFSVASSGHMFIRVKMSMAEAVAAFSSGTDRIEYYPEDDTAVVIDGWTHLAYVVGENDCVRVCLERPINIQEINNG